MIESGRRRGELILTTASGAIKGTGDVPVITPVLFGMSAAIEFLFFIGLMSQQARHLTGRKARHGISTDSGVTLQNLSGFRVQNGAEAPRDTPDSQDAYATLLKSHLYGGACARDNEPWLKAFRKLIGANMV